jgi:hypothetical protein
MLLSGHFCTFNTNNKCTGVCRFVCGIPVGIGRRLAELWVSVGLAEAPAWSRTGAKSPADFRILMTTFRVTWCHWSDLPACGNSASIEYSLGCLEAANAQIDQFGDHGSCAYGGLPMHAAPNRSLLHTRERKYFRIGARTLTANCVSRNHERPAGTALEPRGGIVADSEQHRGAAPGGAWVGLAAGD